MSITIESSWQEQTAYSKGIQFTYEGESYSVLIYWDKWDGYRLEFLEVDEPEWAENWDETHENTLAYELDYLSDELLEGETE